MIKTYKCALLPTKAQKKKLDKMLRTGTLATNFLVELLREQRLYNKDIAKEQRLWPISKGNMYAILAGARQSKIPNAKTALAILMGLAKNNGKESIKTEQVAEGFDSVSEQDIHAFLKTSDLQYIPAMSFNAVIKQLDQANKDIHKNWQNYASGKTTSCPDDLHFRSVQNRASICYPTITDAGALGKTVKQLLGNHSKKQKISLPVTSGEQIVVKISYHRPIPSKPSGIRVKREPSGKYFICFTCECPDKSSTIAPIEKVGIDMGCKSIAAFSRKIDFKSPIKMENEQIVKNPRYYKVLEDRREFLAKKFSALQEKILVEFLTHTGQVIPEVADSRNLRGLRKKIRNAFFESRTAVRGGDTSKIADLRFYRGLLTRLGKARLAIARLEEHVANCRHDFSHQLTRQIVEQVQKVVVEKLEVKKMQKKVKIDQQETDPAKRKTQKMRKNAQQSLGKTGISAILQTLKAKCGEYGRTFVEVEPRGTTRTCSECGAVRAKSLDEREHKCPECGAEMDRDINAAKVICARGDDEKFIVKEKVVQKRNLGFNGKRNKEELPLAS